MTKLALGGTRGGLLFIMIVVVSVAVLVWFLRTPRTHNLLLAKDGARKKVLFYTSFYGMHFVPGTSYGGIPSQCGYSCEWTTDRAEYFHSDAVVFSLRNEIWQKDFVLQEIPARRDKDQIWAFIILEPQGFFYPNQLKMLEDKFNLSITFQSDSDISIPLGTTTKLSPQEIASKSKVDVNFSVGRDKLVAWLVSNCFTGSRREIYVAELKKHIAVDIFGHCGNKSRDDHSEPDYQKILSRYIFYLAFENSNCDDYITEKFWVNLRKGLIPVVRGRRAHYEKYAPPNSYIHADDFAGPKKLAEYLKKIASNQRLLYTFHRWRKHYRVEHSGLSINKHWVCDFCQRIHEMPEQTVDVYAHFSEDTRCSAYLDNGLRNRSGEYIQNLTCGAMLPTVVGDVKPLIADFSCV